MKSTKRLRTVSEPDAHLKDASAGGETQRIDQWLWRARLAKTRAIAAELADKGRIRLTRFGTTSRVGRASFLVRRGDIIGFFRGERFFEVEVAGFAAQRAAPRDVRLLYSVMSSQEAAQSSE